MGRIVFLAVLCAGSPAMALNCADAQLGAKIGYPYAQIVTETRANCKRGETVHWPAGNVAVISATCDMSKSVVRTGSDVICAYSGK